MASALSACGGDDPTPVRELSTESAPVAGTSGQTPSSTPAPAQPTTTGSPNSPSSSQAVDVTAKIYPGGLWLDDRNLPIQAHGGGMLKVGDTYYWIGEDKTGDTSIGFFKGVACYSSKNLQDWKFEGELLSPDQNPNNDLDLRPDRIVERPKVIYNDFTKKYVMYFHADSIHYSYNQIGVAVGDTPCGQYKYRGSTLVGTRQGGSRDMTLYKDDDGSGFLVSTTNDSLKIFRLSDDYTSFDPNKPVATFGLYEAPALFKAQGHYFMIASHLSGWGANDDVYFVSDSITGKWSSPKTLAKAGTNTYSSQSTFVLPIAGTEGTSYLYMGDRWIASWGSWTLPADDNTGSNAPTGNKAGALYASSYIWLPLQVNGTELSLPQWHDVFGINLTKGSFSIVPATYYNGASVDTQRLNGATFNSSCALCFTSQSSIGYLGGASNGTVNFTVYNESGDTSSRLNITYSNADAFPRYATISVNGKSLPKAVEFRPTEWYGGSVAESIQLQPGKNTISISGATVPGQFVTYAPDVQQIFITQ